MPVAKTFAADVSIQVKNGKNFRPAGRVDVDVTDFLSLPAEGVRGLIREFDRDNAPYVENLPGEEAAALSAAHGGPTECRVEFMRFLEELGASPPGASLRDTSWLDEDVMANARAAAGYVAPEPGEQASAVFEVDGEYVAVRRESGTWKHAGTFRTDAEAVEASERQSPAMSR